MRILFLPLITGGTAIGTISRCLAVASHLRSMGHTCAFLSHGSNAGHVRQAGYQCFEGVVPPPPGAAMEVRDLSDVAVLLNLTDPGYLHQALDCESRAVAEFRPDVLVSEFKLTAPMTAARHGLPLVSTACSPGDPRFRSPLFAGLRPQELDRGHALAVHSFNRVLDELGQEPVQNVAELFFGRSQVKLAPTSRDMEPLLGDVPGLHYVGHLLYDAWEKGALQDGLLEKARGRRLLFAYFSTGMLGPETFTRVLPLALDRSDYHAVIAVGSHPHLPELPPDSDGATWVRFAPGSTLLSHCAGLIFHGGQNTAMASLIQGVPSLVYPGREFERDFNARGLAKVGAALHLPLEAFEPGSLTGDLAAIDTPVFRDAAAGHGAHLLDLGGPARAAQLVAGAA